MPAADRAVLPPTARRRRAFHGGRAVEAQLGAFARLHLIAKKKAGKVTDTWLESTELFLERAVSYFGAERELDTIRVSDIRGWIAFLDALKTPAGRRLGPATIRLHLSALSNLYRRAQEEEVVFPGYNPVAALMEKPTPIRREAKWIETHDAAVLLLAAKALPPRGGTSLDADAIAQIRATWELGKTPKLALARAYGVSNVWITRILEAQDATAPVHEAQVAYPLIATFLLTGGRESEVTGLELDDVSLDRQTITFRPNAWRRLKTPGSHRVVRIWPPVTRDLGPLPRLARAPARGAPAFPVALVRHGADDRGPAQPARPGGTPSGARAW